MSKQSTEGQNIFKNDFKKAEKFKEGIQNIMERDKYIYKDTLYIFIQTNEQKSIR